ncbi:MAG TPA: hypothetical protein VFY45_15290 [Baekduia sp.]|nr:hypothetical protein [Baekduia sp.]
MKAQVLASILASAVSWAALASSLLAVVGLVVLRRQMRQSERSLLGDTSQFCYESMSVLLQQLVTHPRLRPYLYENATLPSSMSDGELRQQILAMAAQYADFFDALLLQEALGNISAHEYNSVWRRFTRHMLSSSSAIRDYCLEHPNWYSPELLVLARAAAPSTLPDVFSGRRG